MFNTSIRLSFLLRCSRRVGFCDKAKDANLGHVSPFLYIFLSQDLFNANTVLSERYVLIRRSTMCRNNAIEAVDEQYNTMDLKLVSDCILQLQNSQSMMISFPAPITNDMT